MFYSVWYEEDPSWRLPRAVSSAAVELFRTLWATPQPVEGLGVSYLASRLRRSEIEVYQAAQELIHENVIFTTVDLFTWAAFET